jgi:hypothetical protein
MKLLAIFRRSNLTPDPAASTNTATMLHSATKQHSSPISPAHLLVNYKSTPTSIAAATVDKAVRSVVHPDVLRTVDSAIGQVFYSGVFDTLYPTIRNAVLNTWRASAPPS